MSMLQIVPEDDAHKLLIVQTKSGARDINDILSMEREVLNDSTSVDSDGNALTLDAQKVNEVINIATHAKMKYTEIDGDFRFKDIDRKDFDNFELSNA